MKKITTLFILVMCILVSNAQNDGKFKNLELTKKLIMNRTITGISNDSTGNSKSSNLLITEKAAKDYTDLINIDNVLQNSQSIHRNTMLNAHDYNFGIDADQFNLQIGDTGLISSGGNLTLTPGGSLSLITQNPFLINNNGGDSGQVLMSNGIEMPPSWGSISVNPTLQQAYDNGHDFNKNWSINAKGYDYVIDSVGGLYHIKQYGPTGNPAITLEDGTAVLGSNLPGSTGGGSAVYVDPFTVQLWAESYIRLSTPVLYLDGPPGEGSLLAMEGLNSYINFGTSVEGFFDGGYGFRDSSGIMQYKNLGGNWASFSGGSYATGWDDMLAQEQSQTEERIIYGDGQNLLFNNFNGLNFQGNGFELDGISSGAALVINTDIPKHKISFPNTGEYIINNPDHDSKVGIGTSSPAEALDVDGNIQATQKILFNQSGVYPAFLGGGVVNDETGLYTNDGLMIATYQGGQGYWYGAGGLFINNPDAIFSTNVGIGTGNVPTEALDVNGNIRTTGVIQQGVYTVSTLPTDVPVGTFAYVTDALSPTYLAPVVGGGSVGTSVSHNGTTWVVN